MTLAAALVIRATILAAQPLPQRANTAIVVPEGTVLPQWPKVKGFSDEPGLVSIRSQEVEVIHGKRALDGFMVRVKRQAFAIGSGPRIVGYVAEGELRWVDLASSSLEKQKVVSEANEIRVEFDSKDKDGGTWRVIERFRPESEKGSIQVSVEISVDRELAIACMPMLLLFPGVGSFGGEKNQGLLAGLEYLENEPSSSEADVIGPASKRQVPDSLKITFPLMTIQAEGRYLGLAWQMRPHFSAIFDSPDHLLKSGGHVMGLLYPGSNGKTRKEGSLLPRIAQVLRPGQPVRLEATILGGVGNTVVPAIQHFIRLRSLPGLPGGPDLPAYVSLAGGGWLDSKIRETNLVRHALAGNSFPPRPAADAALWMEWLADREKDSARATELQVTLTNMLAAVAPENLDFAGVGHVRYPVESLVFGAVAQNSEHAGKVARDVLANFESDGGAKYRAKPGGPDYGRTHPTNEACGFTSRLVVDLLENSAFSGEQDLLKKGLEKLRALDRFHGGVPRGAQTWECPLHTPDILAAAQMVRAYALGFELTGETNWLEEAHYWAWTGLPFVYLVNPTEQPVGLYSTIAVFGATQWEAPVWFGLPVQWCGLVYADALYRLARHDPHGIWKHLADGITVSGIQQSWPLEDPQYKGLLPDSFGLREQKRNGPAINPATVEACASQFFGPVPVYDFRCLRTNGLQVHAPGQISDVAESGGRAVFQVRTWLKRPYFILINGISAPPRIRLNGKRTEPVAPHRFLPERKQLILHAQGTVGVELESFN